MEFKSQICTTREQSQKLLALGLKKGTADMAHNKNTIIPKYKIIQVQDWELLTELEEVTYIPAWSLHRLIELVDGNICIDDFAIEWAYDTVIDHIAFDIRHDQFNHEYLEDK